MHDATIAGSERSGHDTSGGIAIAISSRIEIIEAGYRQSPWSVDAPELWCCKMVFLAHFRCYRAHTVEGTDGAERDAGRRCARRAERMRSPGPAQCLAGIGTTLSRQRTGCVEPDLNIGACYRGFREMAARSTPNSWRNWAIQLEPSRTGTLTGCEIYTMDADCPAPSLATCKRRYVRSTATFVDRVHRRQNLRLCSGHRMIPKRVPSGAITQMPPGPVQYTRPTLSTFKPSGMPGSEPSFRSAKMLRPIMLPLGSSLIAWMYCDERVF